MWCLIQGLILSSFILPDSVTSVSAFLLFFPQTIVCHCFQSLHSFLYPLALLSSPTHWHRSYLLILLLFLLISSVHSFFSRSRFQLFKPVKLNVCRSVFVSVCGIWCVGSNIVAAILERNPWRYPRQGVCYWLVSSPMLQKPPLYSLPVPLNELLYLDLCFRM